MLYLYCTNVKIEKMRSQGQTFQNNYMLGLPRG
jgi:hypothetical protein